MQLIHQKQLVERSVASTQHTVHHNGLLMAQQQEEARMLRDKYRQLESLYGFEKGRRSSLEAKLDECVKEKLQLQHENRMMRHEAERWEQRSRAVDGRRVQAVKYGRVEAWRDRDEPVRTIRELAYGDEEDALSGAEDDSRFSLSPRPAALAPPIRLGAHAERPRVDLTPSSASPHYHPSSATDRAVKTEPAVPSASHASDARSMGRGGGSTTRPPFSSGARKYSGGHA